MKTENTSEPACLWVWPKNLDLWDLLLWAAWRPLCWERLSPRGRRGFVFFNDQHWGGCQNSSSVVLEYIFNVQLLELAWSFVLLSGSNLVLIHFKAVERSASYCVLLSRFRSSTQRSSCTSMTTGPNITGGTRPPACWCCSSLCTCAMRSVPGIHSKTISIASILSTTCV